MELLKLQSRQPPFFQVSGGSNMELIPSYKKVYSSKQLILLENVENNSHDHADI